MASLWPSDAAAAVVMDWEWKRRGDTTDRGVLDTPSIDVCLELCVRRLGSA